MVCEHMNSSLEAALHRRNKYSSYVDVLYLMCILLALVDTYWVKIWIDEIGITFERLYQFSIVIKAIFFDSDLFVIELTKPMPDEENV